MGWAGVGDGFSVMFSTFLNDFFNYSNKKINERYLKFLDGVKKKIIVPILFRALRINKITCKNRNDRNHYDRFIVGFIVFI